MCTQVYGKRWVASTQGELRKHLGDIIFVDDAPEQGRTDEFCLCHVDIEAMAKREGVKCVYDPLGYKIRDR